MLVLRIGTVLVERQLLTRARLRCLIAIAAGIVHVLIGVVDVSSLGRGLGWIYRDVAMHRRSECLEVLIDRSLRCTLYRHRLASRKVCSGVSMRIRRSCIVHIRRVRRAMYAYTDPLIQCRDECSRFFRERVTPADALRQCRGDRIWEQVQQVICLEESIHCCENHLATALSLCEEQEEGYDIALVWEEQNVLWKFSEHKNAQY